MRLSRIYGKIFFWFLYKKYESFTMVPQRMFITNLELSCRYKQKEGVVVECGVWRGGMIAAMSEVLGKRAYYLFDSFEGLPPAREIDGEAALLWQRDKFSPSYYDNCLAEMVYAERAVQKTGKAKDFHLIPGWFSDTLPKIAFDQPIAILRLDGDWYDSTLQCLEYLFPQVVTGGLIIIDDYHTWDGCTRAVHDYLSTNKLPLRIRQFNNRVAYIIK